MSKANKLGEVAEPIKKAFTIERKDGNWVLVELHYRGNQIVDVIKTEPDLKMVAIERFKINSFKYWSTLG